ncbi:MAG TPA: DNA-processing protein DprA [Ktedonobacterales bacterium]
MPRRSPKTPPPDDADSLFASLLDDEAGTSESEARDAGRGGIPPAIPYLEADALDGTHGPRLTAAMGTAFDDPDLPYWLALNRVRGIGPARFRLLLEAFGSARAAWEATASGWQAAGLDTRTATSLEQQRRLIEPAAEVERLIRLRVGVLRLIDPAYPRLLREIPLPPPVLYLRGTLAPQDEWALGIVGTRRASPYGRQMTVKLASELARQSITIVSGLARGIDTFAHHATLEAGGRTIAVLGCGPDLVYPPDNAKLAARMIEQGAILTEFPPGTQPEAGNFPARNRLISGLSLGVLVTEAPETSGALITTRFAAEQGRDVFAVPGNVTSRTSTGANRLIQDGAKMVLEVGDILSELNLHLAPQQIEMLELRETLPENDSEARLLALLDASDEPGHIDDLCRASGMPVAEVSGTLVMLELKGLVRLVGPMTYVKA